jgi:hemerythrin
VALQWSSTLSMGVPSLDAQHRELFDRFDRLLDSMLHGDRVEAVHLSAFLREHVVLYLAAEEQLMLDLNYAEAANHTAEHHAFACKVLALDAAFRDHGPTAELVLRLEREVVTWLRDHVYVADVALGHFVAATLGSPTRLA